MKLIFSFLVLMFSQICFSANDWKFGIGVGYSPNYLVSLSGSGIASGTPYSATYSLQYAATTSLELDFRKLNKNSWGWVSGFEYEPERALTVINGISAGSSSVSKYQTTFLHIGAAYRWDIFYIPFGLAYGLTKFTPAPSFSGTGTAENGVGAFFGFGWYLGEDFAIEYVSRSATTSLKMVSGANSENTSGVLGSALLNLKYFF